MSIAGASDGIEHVVLLMLENHSFDQMLGSLQEIYPALDGVNEVSAATRFNLRLDGTTRVYQKPTTERQMKFDPHHEQINALAHLQNGNGGFVSEFEKAYSKCTIDDLQDVMGYYPLDFLPALHALGRNFTVCDHWFSSLPGPTWPNRFFALTGTCHGEPLMPAGMQQLNPKWYVEQSQDTLFDRLTQVGRRWAIYYYDFPSSLVLKNMRTKANLAGYKKIDEFFSDAAGDPARFPEFTFIEPQYFGVAQNDDHPPHNVMKAEKLIGDVYNAIRSNPKLWEKTLLVVAYDEHGGFYDHVVPPATVAPDEFVQAYDFRQFGVRVPAILVSPHCEARVEKTVFDHTSLLRYLSDKWGFAPLGLRAQQANSIAVALRPQLNRADTIPFIRVPNSVLISEDVDAEKDAENANQTALHHFAEFIYQGIDRGLADAVSVTAEAASDRAGPWTRFKHWVGSGLSSIGQGLSEDLRAHRAQRDARTSNAVDYLRGQ
jgi:phospholipase C